MFYNYYICFLGTAVICLLLEWKNPWRKKVYQGKEYLQDLFFFIFNTYVFSMILGVVLGPLESKFDQLEECLRPYTLFDTFNGLPLLAQILSLLFLKDFLEYWVHRMLHRISFLWRYHKLHHTVKEIYWIENFRFHWMELIVYKSLKYLPLVFFSLQFGISWQAVFWVGILSTLIGNLNHTNTKMDYGIFKYLINSPSLHVWHHDKVNHFKYGQNFGVVLSVWDWVFSTMHYLPNDYPKELGFVDEEKYPKKLIKKVFYF